MKPVRELIDVAWLGKFCECVHVDQPDLGRFTGFFELLDELVDSLQLFLHFQCLGDGHRFAPDEFVLRGEFVDLIFVAQGLDQSDQSARKGRLIIARGIP